jgi:hypothetical protein
MEQRLSRGDDGFVEWEVNGVVMMMVLMTFDDHGGHRGSSGGGLAPAPNPSLHRAQRRILLGPVSK